MMTDSVDPGRIAPAAGRSRHARRRAVFGMLAGFFLINACGAKPMKVVLNVCVYSYLDRPIFEVLIDGKVDELSGVYPEIGGRTRTGIEFALGPKRVTWRLDGPPGTPHNGDMVESKNRPSLDEVVPGARYLAVHIYPDGIVELVTTVARPRVSPRGEIEIARMKAERGN